MRIDDRAGGSDRRVLGVDPFAVHRGAALLDELHQQLERLLRPAESMVEGIAEGGVLRVMPAGADAQGQPATADLIGRRCHLGQQRRIAHPESQDQRAQVHPVGRSGERGQHAPRFVDAALRRIREAEERVIDDPQPIDAQ